MPTALATSPTAAAHGDGAPSGLTWPKIIAWSVGTIGPVTLLYLISSAYLFFMTDLMLMSGALAGALIFGVRVYDMFADPIMGYISDRTRSRMGRRRPWMLLGSVVTVAGCVALFTVPGGIAASGGMLVAWTLLALVLYFTGYTMFNVPYMAMPAEMTDSFHDRTRLMSVRVVFVSLSSLLGAALAPRLIEAFGNGVPSYEKTSWIIGAIGLLAMVACVLGTRTARATSATPVTMPMIAQMRVAFSNRPFVVLVLTKLLLLLSMSSITTTMFFFVRHVLNRELSVASDIALAQTLGMLVLLPLWVKVAKRYRKQHLFMIASGGNTLVLLSWLFATANEPAGLLLLRAAMLGAFAGGSLLMGQSMLPDTMEYDYRRSRLRREGAYSGIYSMVEKAGFAFGPLLVGGLLSLAGYEGAAPGETQAVLSDDATIAVYLGVSVIPAIATALCLFVLRAYTLTEEQLKSMTPPTPA
jgi:GPH family glycoside/pentoside/hexuronide:cation symporter